jgi:predicted double-glycine peptidase
MQSGDRFFEMTNPPDITLSADFTAEEATNDQVVLPETRNRKRSIDVNRVPYYYKPPISDIGNSCGSTMMATLITYWGLNAADESSWLQTNPNSKPDILFGVLGTSWEKMTRYLLSRGMIAHGDNSPRYTVNTEKQKFDWLCQWVNAGYPVAVIVGNGELDNTAGAHWGLVVDINSSSTVLANFPDPAGLYKTTTDKFLNAWRCYWIPGVHYASVIAYRQ